MTPHSEAPACRLSIPVPPSVNHAFRNVSQREREAARRAGRTLRGRARTAGYQKWATDAGWEVRRQIMAMGLQGRVAVPGEIVIEIAVARGWADIDNLLKPTLDLLVTMLVIDDDRFVRRLSIEHGQGIEQMEISIWPMA